MITLNSRLQLAMLNRKKSKNLLKNGFTLIELLVVVVIVGVLSSVALPRFLGASENADKNASMASTLGMAKECGSWLKLGVGKKPTFATNNLVTVTQTTDCVGTFATAKDQAADPGTLCVNQAATTDEKTTCTVEVDQYGDRTGTWS